MANALNIDFANFSLNDLKMFLYDPAVYIREWGTDDTLVPIGYMEREKSFKASVKYAEFKTGIPENLIRKDVISQEFIFEGKLKQFNPDSLALVMQRTIDTVTASGYSRILIGSETPSPVFLSMVLIGQTVDGKELRLYIRKLQVSSEDVEVMLGSDKYADLQFKGTALKDANPLVSNPDWDFVSKLIIEDGVFTSADPDITFPDATGLSSVVAGSPVVSTYAPVGATVLSVDAVAFTITMSANATGAGTADVITKKTSTFDENEDNVAFWKIQD